MNKKFFVLSMVLILLLFALSLSACSNNFPPSEPSTENTEPSVVTDPTAEPTAPDYTNAHWLPCKALCPLHLSKKQTNVVKVPAN